MHLYLYSILVGISGGGYGEIRIKRTPHNQSSICLGVYQNRSISVTADQMEPLSGFTRFHTYQMSNFARRNHQQVICRAYRVSRKTLATYVFAISRLRGHLELKSWKFQRAHSILSSKMSLF